MSETTAPQFDFSGDLQSIINRTPSCLKIINQEGLLLSMNPRGLCLIEANDFSEVDHANVYDIVEETHRDRFIEFNRRVCSGESGTMTFEIVGLGGTRRWMETYAAPFRLPNGDVAHIAITNDITEKREWEQTIENQRQALMQTARLASLGQFVAGVAHEINNPLSIIMGKASLLRDRIASNGLDADFGLRVTNDIVDTVKRVSGIISGLKTFSRQKPSEKMAGVNLRQIVHGTIKLCEDRFRLSGIELKSDVADVVVNGSEVQISQVLMNLLNNSAEAVTGSADKRVEMGTRSDERFTYLYVRDSGPTIPDDVARHMMNPFYTTKDVGKGTGLGLSISLGIMKSHGGDLIFDNGANETEFVMKFPKAM